LGSVVMGLGRKVRGMLSAEFDTTSRPASSFGRLLGSDSNSIAKCSLSVTLLKPNYSLMSRGFCSVN
jgi:hypothetical protein